MTKRLLMFLVMALALVGQSRTERALPTGEELVIVAGVFAVFAFGLVVLWLILRALWRVGSRK